MKVRDEPLEVPIPPVFCTKSPQAIENKRRELQKERQERIRVRKLMRIEDLSRKRLTQ